MLTKGKRIFGLLAAILEYPSPDINSQIDKSMAGLPLMSPEAKLHLDRFRRFCSDNPLSRLEEIYRKTFDLNAPCSPYVGHHLFNYDRSRTMFQARLRKQHPGIAPRNIHPDHIADMLRSLIVQESVEEALELVACCLIPALRKMIARLEDNGNPYQPVLQSVLLTLETMDDVRCVVA